MTYIVQFTFYSCLILHQPGVYIHKTCFIWAFSKMHRTDLNMKKLIATLKIKKPSLLSNGFWNIKQQLEFHTDTCPVITSYIIKLFGCW